MLEVNFLKLATPEGVSVNFVSDAATAVINGVLTPAQALLNRVELRIPTTIVGKIDLKAKQQQGLVVVFDPNNLQVTLQVADTAYLTDRGRLYVVAQEGGALKNLPNKPTNVSFGALRTDFRKALASSEATWLDNGQISAYVNWIFLQQIIFKLLGSGPICMQAKMKDLPMPFSTKITLPPLESIDCTPTTDCTPTGDCTPKIDCSQNQDCSACIVHNPFGGCVVRGNDPICFSASDGIF